MAEDTNVKFRMRTDRRRY